MVTGQEKVILKSGGKGRSSGVATMHGTGTAEGHTTAQAIGDSTSGGVVTYPDGTEGPTTEAWGLNYTASDGTSYVTSETSAETRSQSETDMNSWTEAFKTTYGTAVGGHFSLEEQRYKKVAWLKKQPVQMALLVRPDFSLVPFRVSDVTKPRTNERMTNKFIQKRYKAIPCVMPDTDSLALG